MKVFLPVAGFLGFVSVLLSALGTHYYSHTMALEDFAYFTVAVCFQLLHSIVLFALGLFGFVAKKNQFRLLIVSGYLMVTGILFFSGDIYLTTMTGETTTKFLTPVGGAFILAAWAMILIAGVYYYLRAVDVYGR